MRPPSSVPDLARALLCLLRDLNLTSSRVAIAADRSVHIDGCLSLGWPSASPLCYRLRTCDGRERVLRIELVGDALSLCVADRSGRPDGEALSVPLSFEERNQGWLTARAIGARIATSGAGARDAEHFLRRAVRGAFGTVPGSKSVDSHRRRP
jgi:hypothetical protein